ncbi:hypothetical protein KC19_9G052400 [Ceratodon purpureus]|uniref:Protein TONSOKU n=1 Tax=Ceratodon purpureus TaxID=3225 RepID=A0A8T0GWJ4_CERPU|nr:hypothetical protein KC19_9G052400 [Ceratodon purpureus]
MGRKGKKADGPEGMKSCFRAAKESGDREEMARWANQIGHAYKDRGDYVEALTWFRLDYDISAKRQSEAPRLSLMPTCQSLGEVYHRLGDYKEALTYQERHLELAVEADDLVEQQRSLTQLGRTYLDLYEMKDDIMALPKAKDALNRAMELVKKLKANPPPGSSNFVVELVDAYNNLALLKMVTDEPLEAKRLLQLGLKICDDEEIGQNDAARTRVHHNLGRLYSERRQFLYALNHVLEDIRICRALPHPQGEAKGLINLGDIYFKRREYEQAMECYKGAHDIVRKLQDEDMLLKNVELNKEIVQAAIPKLAVLNERLAKHKELQAQVDAAHGTASERSLCLQEYKFVKELIGQAFELQFWEEHLKLGKRLKKLTNILGDLEKIGDAFETIGESYQNLCDYNKAKKWYHKSLEACKRVHHKEGQAVALINFGNALDSSGDYKGALKSFRQAHDVLKQTEDTQHLDQKINALENMHYCYVVRFNKISDARGVEAELNRLKRLKEGRGIQKEDSDEVCSETDDEAEKDDEAQVMDLDDEVPAWEPLLDNTQSTRISDPEKKPDNCINVARRSQAPKRSRVVVSDDESEESAGATLPSPPKRKFTRSSVKNNSATKSHPSSSGRKTRKPETDAVHLSSDDDLPLSTAIPAATRKKTSLLDHDNVKSPKAWSAGRLVDVSNGSRRKDEDFNDESQPEDVEERCEVGGVWDVGHTGRGSRGEARKSTSSHHDGANSHNSEGHARSSVMQAPLIVPVNINGQTLRVIIRRSETDINRTVGWLMEEIIRLYTCDNSAGKKPVVQRLEFKGSILKPVQIIEEVLTDLTSDDSVDAIIQGWVAIPVLERYEAHCIAASANVNPALALKLKVLKGSCEEIDASSCDLQDISAKPFIAALQENDALSSLDLSHNLLGNATMHAIQEMIAATKQNDLGLTLDLHMNQLGAAALTKIAKCPVTLSRLEVLKLSGNRLTDAAGRNLAAILAQSKALATLEIEGCGLTTRTIQQISSSLQPESSLVKLCIGHNNPIGGSALSILFQKLSGLLSFTELDLRGIELDEKGVLAVTSLMKSSSSLSVLNMAGCEIQNHDAQVMCRALMGSTVQLLNINMSSCGLSREPALEVCQQLTAIHGLATLNLSNNQLNEQAIDVLSVALRQEGCRLKSVILNNCSIGQSGVLHLLESLEGNSVLWELHIAGNFSLGSLEPQVMPQTDLDTGNTATQQIPPSSRSARSQGQAAGGSQADPTVVENCTSDTALKSVEPAQGDMEQSTSGYPSDHNAQNVSNKPSGHVDLLNEDTQLNEDLFYSPKLEIKTEVVDGLETAEPVEVMDGVDEPEAVTRVADPVVEELAVKIRLARGLQCLNMSENGLNSEDLKQLWEAWCDGGRMAQQEFIGNAHFAVQDGRKCTALITSCVLCQPRT